MKKIKLVLLILLIRISCLGQNFSISNDKMNVFYIGADNPVSFAVEGIKNTDLIVKTVNGRLLNGIVGRQFHPDSVGVSEIILYVKSRGKLKEVGRAAFRSKHLPLPTFHIGSTSTTKSKKELEAQEYVRAELENFDFEVKYNIERFKVCIFSGDTCKFSVINNSGNKITGELKTKFSSLETGDTVLFKDIYIKQPDGTSAIIEPLIISIK